MKIICCKCGKEYILGDNIFEYNKANHPILICPFCNFKHIINFMPFEKEIETKKIEKLELGAYYVTLGASRIANASRVDQSGSDDGVVADWVKTDDFILATRFYGSKGAYDRAYKLRWMVSGGTFADVIDTGAITHSATTDLTDDGELVIGEKLCDVQTDYTWQNGLESEGDNISPDAGTYSLADEYYTEFQWALSCDDATDGATYEFELWDITEPQSIGTCVATITMAAAAVTPQTCTGALSFIGNILKQGSFLKTLSGISTFAGETLKQSSLSKAISGALNFIGELIADSGAAKQIISGALSFTGNLRIKSKKNLFRTISFIRKIIKKHDKIVGTD